MSAISPNTSRQIDFLNAITQTTTTVTVPVNAKISEMKAAIAKANNVLPHNIEIFFAGKKIDDNDKNDKIDFTKIFQQDTAKFRIKNK